MDSNQKIRVGVIGAGWFASRRHLPVLAESRYAETVALCRRNEAMLQQMAEHFDVQQTFTDYITMLDSVAMDAVLIATPHALHYEQAKAALERNLHVLLEKPMALTRAEARELNALAGERERVLLVAMNPPYWAHCQFMKEAIQIGKVGEVESFSINWVGDVRHVFGKAPMPSDMPGVVPPTLFRSQPDAAGGGHLMDTGCHVVCEALWVTGLRAKKVSALMDNTDTDLRCVVNLEFENGAFGSISLVGDSQAQRRIRNTYFGSAGTLTAEGMPFRVTLSSSDTDSVTTDEKAMEFPPQPVENFIDAILGREDVLCTGNDGERVVEVLEAAYRSARDGCAVSLGNEA